MPRRLPDPSWKSGPPDPPAWTVHTHEFEYAEADVEVLDEYVYVYQRCQVDDGHPYDPQRCEATRTIVYHLDRVEQVKLDQASGEYVGGEVDPRGPHSDVYNKACIKAMEKLREDPFSYDILDESLFEVEVKAYGAKFFVVFTHDETTVDPW